MNPKNPSWIGGMAAVATAGVLALAPPAWSGTKCNLRYSLAGWSAIYSTASGTGTATCDNGQSARVSLRATGGGLTTGKSKIVNGTGTFSEVSNINELFGKYASVEAHAGMGDGSLGFWAAVRDVWPKTREQRDWFHKLGNILDKLPKRLQPRVKAALHEVMYAETREQARAAITRFATEYGAKYPKAVTTLEQDAEVLLTFFDFPAEHWKHLRTSNVIESPFATVRLRQRVTKGAGSRTKGLLMAYKLLDMAQARWRRLDGAHLLPLVRAGITFVDGVQHATTGRRSSARAA